MYLGVFHTVKSSVFIGNMTGKQLDSEGKIKKSLNIVNLYNTLGFHRAVLIHAL